MLTRRSFLLGASATLALPALMRPAEARGEGEAYFDVAYGADPAQRYDVYMPRRDLGIAAPVVFMLHGGSWRAGDKRDAAVWKAKATWWTARGYGFVSTNTRLLPQTRPLDQARDLTLALSDFAKRAPGLGLDPTRLALMGHSAGAHVAGLVLSRSDMTYGGAFPVPLAGVLIDSASYDVEAVMSEPQPLAHFRNAFGTDRSYWRAVSLTAQIARLPEAPIPLLLVHSTRPARAAAATQAQLLAAAASQHGGRVEMLPLDLSHFSLNAQMGRANSYTDRTQAFLGTVGLP